MSIWAIVPVKPLKRAKSRLASVLSVEEREAFSRMLLTHTLDVVAQVSDIEKILVVSRDTTVLRIAREHDARTVTESGAPELNAALTRAANLAASFGADAVLVVSTDLPLMTPFDLEAMIASADSSHSSIVIAPDRHDASTNAIFMRPPRIVPFVFGPDSFAHYTSLAKDRGIEAYIHRAQGLMWDVDTPEDLELYRDASKQVSM
ncbi:MAG: 2-phospho-L-lactate guanylyltransferase, partial [Chloroflexota bacterium]